MSWDGEHTTNVESNVAPAPSDAAAAPASAPAAKPARKPLSLNPGASSFEFVPRGVVEPGE